MLRLILGVIIGLWLFSTFSDKKEVTPIDSDEMVITEIVTPQQVMAESSAASLKATLESQTAAMKQTEDRYNTDLLKYQKTQEDLQNKLKATETELVTARELITNQDVIIDGLKKERDKFKADLDTQESRIKKLEEANQKINWMDNIYEARMLSEKIGRPLYIDFELKGCEPCKLVKKQTYENTDVSEFLKLNCVPVWIYLETPQDALAAAYDVHEFPKGVVSFNGRNLVISPSSNPQEFLRQLNEQLSRIQKEKL